MIELALSDRLRRIKVSPSSAAAQRVRELKAQGRDILDLTIGEPDFDTPANIKAAAIEAINRETKYISVNGIPALCEAIAAKLRRRLGVTYPLDQITVGGEAKQLIFLALMASLDAGSEVIIPTPYWVSYPDMVLANDGKPVIVACSEEQGFKITAAHPNPPAQRILARMLGQHRHPCGANTSAVDGSTLIIRRSRNAPRSARLTRWGASVAIGLIAQKSPPLPHARAVGS